MLTFTTSFSVLHRITVFPRIIRAWLYREGWMRKGRFLHEMSIPEENAEESMVSLF